MDRWFVGDNTNKGVEYFYLSKMASIVWDRNPQEAMDNPYEYNAQSQFDREATTLCTNLCNAITSKNSFTVVDQSLDKATWLLQTDALHAFKDAVELLKMKKHKVVGRLLRDILETLHLVEYLNSGCAGSADSLQKWYYDEPRTDRLFRQYIKATLGDVEHELHRSNYEALSKFTHRTYKVLLYGYCKLGDDKLYYDENWTLPGTIAMYYALLGWMGQMIMASLKMYGVFEADEVVEFWNNSMEDFQIPRGYLSKEDKEFLGVTDDNTFTKL